MQIMETRWSLPEFLNKVADEEILIRLLRNLRCSYIESYSYDKAIRCTELALALEPNTPEEIRDKGNFRGKILHYEKHLSILKLIQIQRMWILFWN